ncbi:MAG: Rid family detoxifying hydrolase [Bacteroidales bacterium]|nr:Rid family detoxifying hydrolase [Bacteroidales bacterium]
MSSIVYFTRDLSSNGLIKAYEKVAGEISGKVGVKLHTGEKNGPNIIPREWVKALIDKDLPEATIIETNTYYEGDRYTTELHRETIEVNGWTFCPVDILDEEGTVDLPVVGGKWFDKMSVGSHLVNYDSMVALTHFKGHTQGGFGGSNKNIGIGCADGRIGKAWIHTTPGQPDQWDIAEEEFMERMTESTKASIDHFGEKVTYVNVMRNMSVSCDCEGLEAEPVVTPDVGILSSTDILAVDKACVDIIYAMTEADHHDMVERIESRHGLRQLSYMKELGMGDDDYILIDLDNGGRRMTVAEAATGLKRQINTDMAPAAIGPYSQAIAHRGLVFVSGQLPIDPSTGAFPDGGVEAQTRQSLMNIKAILEQAGSGMDKVVKTTVLLADMGDFAAMNGVYSEFFSAPYPARCAFAVKTLPKGALVEIECIASGC